jgi:glutathione-regulated potassium-efflux system ancillary protein KefF
MAEDILVLLAHPDLRHSRVNRHLAEQLKRQGGVHLRDLYARYPDYWIDVDAEQAALRTARLVVWLHPIHWYGMPPLMKLWVDEVLRYGWAYGPEGRQLAGKDLLLVASTGGGESAYTPDGHHGHGFDAFLPPYRQTAALCHMRFLTPAVFHDAHRQSAAALDGFCDALLQRLRQHPQGEDGLWPVVPEVSRAERPQEESR